MRKKSNRKRKVTKVRGIRYLNDSIVIGAAAMSLDATQVQTFNVYNLDTFVANSARDGQVPSFRTMNLNGAVQVVKNGANDCNGFRIEFGILVAQPSTTLSFGTVSRGVDDNSITSFFDAASDKPFGYSPIKIINGICLTYDSANTEMIFRKPVNLNLTSWVNKLAKYRIENPNQPDLICRVVCFITDNKGTLKEFTFGAVPEYEMIKQTRLPALTFGGL